MFALILLSTVTLKSYIIGSVPFGFILSKVFLKQDVRSIGSGNIGATNVLRTGSKKLAFLTLILDAIKGPIAIFAYIAYATTISSSNTDISYRDFDKVLLLISGFIAIIGHCFPIWLKFKGGKGVATSAGVLLTAVPYAGLAVCAAWLMAVFVFRISSLAALIAAAIAPIATYVLYGQTAALICALITALIFVRHKDNIARLMKGEEPKIKTKKQKAQASESVSK